MIPFKYGAVVSGGDFCGRGEEIKQLTEFIISSQNVFIQGERRIGKSSLIYETVRKIKNRKAVFVDLMGIKSSQEFCQRTVKSIISSKAENGFFTKALNYFASLKPKVGMDPVTGMPTVSLDPSVELAADALEEIFDVMRKIGKKNTVVVLDEFQDVLNLKDSETTLAVLRSKIQYHANIAYIFAGSIRNRMDEIFTRPDSPLFKSAIPITVGPLREKDLSDFITKKFLTGKRTITDGALKRIFHFSDNITGDIQQLCEALWSVTSYGDSINEDHLASAFKLIFARESKSYEWMLSELTAVQLKCLVGLSRVGGKTPTSSSFLKASGIRQPSSVTKAIKKLLKLQVIFKSNKEYRFVNPFFKAWLNARNL